MGQRASEESPHSGRQPDAPPDNSIKWITPRESQLLKLLGQAKSNKQIAAELGITEQTVKNKLQLVYLKLGVYNRTGAVIKAIKEGLITIGS